MRTAQPPVSRTATAPLVASLFCLTAAPHDAPATTGTLRGKAMTIAPAATSWPLVELRRYTPHPGRRDDLVDLFEREFLEPQEAAGMQVLLHAREPAAPDRFVWFRGFRDLPSRAPALATFYDGPVWLAHRGAANATMLDSDDVHLLREAQPGSGFAVPAARPRAGTPATSAIVDVSI